MKRISVTFLSFVISATVNAQTSSANPSPENPVQAISKGIGGIFGALTSILNPRVAEIKKLHEERRYEEAREAMLRQSDKYLETELTELKALLKPTLELDYQEKVAQAIKEISLGPDVSSLSDAAEKIWVLEQYTNRLIPQLDFFGVSAYSIEAKKSEWIKSYIELVEKYAATTSSTPSGDKAYYIRKMAAEAPSLLKSCNDALTEKFEKNAAALCRVALEGEVWNRLEKKILENDVTRIVEESRQSPPQKRLQSLFSTLNNFNIDKTKWRDFLKASELELIYADQRQWLAEQLTPKDSQILIVRLEPEIQQTNGQSTIASEYTSGRETLPNPQYLQAQRYYQEVQQGYQNCEAQVAINSINNPYTVNMCFLWGGRIRESRQLIDSTSPTISRDLTTPYQIAANEIKVQVRDTFAVIALNGAREPVYILAQSTREK
ncbi:MAG: hypothetical protein O2836_09955, partial [Proteobacteria bacterium]|nr:hypothetical protein [Pseudomonadota bacterium]